MRKKWNPIGADGADFQSRGMERGLLRAAVGMLRWLKKCPTVFKIPQRLLTPSDNDGYVRGARGTPNHRFGSRVVYYIKAMIIGTAEQKADARSLVLDFFKRQATTDGHMIGEEFTTSHAQIWYAFVAIIRAVALHFGDEVVVKATSQWLRRDAWLLDLCAFEGIPRSPGARPAGNNNPLRTATYALYRGKPCPPLPKGWGNPNIPNSPFYRSAYNVSAWVMQELILDGDDLGGVRHGKREEAVLSDDMDFWWTEAGDYVMSFPGPIRKSGPSFLPWISRINGVELDSQVYRGEFENWTPPEAPPRIPGAFYLRVKGVRK